MAFADKIKIRDDNDSQRIVAEWVEEFEHLSGTPWPPSNAVNWTVILTNAGFDQRRIEQCLREFGYCGFEQSGRLPLGYVTTSKEGMPTFSAALVAGLARWRASLGNAAAEVGGAIGKRRFIRRTFVRPIGSAATSHSRQTKLLASKLFGRRGRAVHPT